MIGCGYVGLVAGTCFAELGHQVTCADNDESKIRSLLAGRLPIYEPYLDGLVASNVAAGRLSFTGNLAEAVAAGDSIFICVGTPVQEDGSTDLAAIDRVARLIATEARSPKLVVEKSTVPVQTGHKLKGALAVYARKSGTDFQVASNPEFLREGTAVHDFLHPNRIIIGVETPEVEQQLREMYRPILERTFTCPLHASPCGTRDVPFIVTSISSAELIKHASNSFLALKISYANLVSDLCERLGADVEQVTHAVGLDPRVGPDFLRAGLGFGGFCLPKDLQALMRIGEDAGVDCGLLRQVESINRRRVDNLVEKARRALWVLADKQIALLGLAFKANTDDIRYAPALSLIRQLQAAGAHVRAYDPRAMEKTREVIPGVQYGPGPYEVAEHADALMIVTDWNEFRDLDWERLRDRMNRPLVFDGRNLLDPARMKALGFEYYSLGRP